MSAPESPAAPRVRRLDGSHNVRDLGGLVSQDGRTVRTGQIFRSDYPGFVDATDGSGVRELGLRTVVDLRRGSEAAIECVAWADHGVAYHRCPVSAGGETSWHAKYHAYLAHRPETVVAALRIVMDAEKRPVLFHCAAGKDRTGVIAALLLLVLGVDAEDVVADYVLTEAGLDPILDRLSGIEMYAEMLGADLEGQRPRAENMRGLLGWIEARGGAEEWMVEHGVERDRIEGFREGMLAPLA